MFGFHFKHGRTRLVCVQSVENLKSTMRLLVSGKIPNKSIGGKNVNRLLKIERRNEQFKARLFTQVNEFKLDKKEIKEFVLELEKQFPGIEVIRP